MTQESKNTISEPPNLGPSSGVLKTGLYNEVTLDLCAVDDDDIDVEKSNNIVGDADEEARADRFDEQVETLLIV